MAKATVVKEIAIYGWAWRDEYGVDWKGKQKLIGYESRCCLASSRFKYVA
jgi:hypothetical protein